MSDCSTHAFDAPLKPCPFCGGEAEPFNPFDNIDGTWCVLCSECAAATGFEQTEAEAIAAWNTRAAYEMDGFFYLPKPKEQLFSYTTGFTFDDLSLKATGAVDVYALTNAIRKWQEEELNQHIVERICEVFKPERTCHRVLDSELASKPGWHIKHRCSECGEKLNDVNYCPNCGCKVVDR